VKEGRQHNNSVDQIDKMKQNRTTESAVPSSRSE